MKSIEEAIVQEDIDCILNLLEKAMENSSAEKSFLAGFKNLPISIQVSIVSIGLVKLIEGWTEIKSKFSPVKEGFLFSKN